MVSFRPIFCSGLLLLGTVSVQAARTAHPEPAQARAMTVHTSGNLSVNFFSLSDSPQIDGAQGVGMVNLGSVSYAAGSSVPGVKVSRAHNGFFVETAVGLRIGNVGVSGGATAILKAWLDSPSGPYRIYLDGVELTTQPAMVDSQTELGVVTRHELRIQVPSTASEKDSSLQTQISVQVVRN